jgi:starch synthase (maltosyl-transferring)
VVNLDPDNTQSGWVSLSLADLGVGDGVNFRVEDLLAGEAYPWRGAHNFVMLDPRSAPAHIFAIRR